jgi:hypothetical protein
VSEDEDDAGLIDRAEATLLRARRQVVEIPDGTTEVLLVHPSGYVDRIQPDPADNDYPECKACLCHPDDPCWGTVKFGDGTERKVRCTWVAVGYCSACIVWETVEESEARIKKKNAARAHSSRT